MWERCSDERWEVQSCHFRKERRNEDDDKDEDFEATLCTEYIWYVLLVMLVSNTSYSLFPL